MNYNKLLPVFLILLVITFHYVCVTSCHAKEIFVDATFGSSSNDGLSWATAKQTLTGGISIAVAGDTIMVAAGKYSETITLINSLNLSGGYPPGGGVRDIRAHETIIDGNFMGTVVTGAPGANVDGFTVINGTGTSPPVWVQPTIGGAFIAYSEMNITNNIIRDNFIFYAVPSQPQGAGIYIKDVGECYIANNFFYMNEVSGPGEGAAIYVSGSNAVIVNNTFVSHKSPNGVISFGDASPVIQNNVFFNCDNIAIKELSSLTELAVITHNVFFENTYVYEDFDTAARFVSASAMDAGVPEATENMDCDPELIAIDDFHVSPSSCCVDSGLTASAPVTDLDGEPRPGGPGIDVGADEVIPRPVPLDSTGIIAILLIILTIRYYPHGSSCENRSLTMKPPSLRR